VTSSVEVVVVSISMTVNGVADKTGVGGLVVRNADGNNAPRQQITINQATPASFNGNLILTVNSSAVSVFDSPSGGTQITFNGTDNVFANSTLAAGKSFWVEGELQSGAMRDIVFTLTTDSLQTMDTANFTVLWLDQPIVATGGRVSSGNNKAAAYKSWTVANTIALGGPQQYNSEFGARVGWGTEARAVVHPTQFSYANSDLKLDKDLEYEDWENGGSFSIGGETFSPTIPGGNDTDAPDTRDDIPDANDTIYDLDAPGLFLSQNTPQCQQVSGCLQGTIHRTRNHFRAFAWITVKGVKVRCSPITEYYVRFSVIETTVPTGTSWVELMPADVTSDDQAGVGTTNLTWNLK
jgi:hypothetical protein